jgi:hypothetical protein
MHTWSKSGIYVPKKNFNLSAYVAISPIPTTYRQALKDPNWFAAIRDEFDALTKQNTWSLVSELACINVVSGKSIFRHKHNSDGSFASYKARWVLHGFTQEQGLNFGETFSLVIKPATVRVVLSIATSKDWPIHQVDVKNAFLHGHLAKTVYAQQPSSFISPTNLDLVCKLNKSLYGLKQAPRTWFLQFTLFLIKLGFYGSKSDTSLFVLHHGSSTSYLLLYVDDIILTASSESPL